MRHRWSRLTFFLVNNPSSHSASWCPELDMQHNELLALLQWYMLHHLPLALYLRATTTWDAGTGVQPKESICTCSDVDSLGPTEIQACKSLPWELSVPWHPSHEQGTCRNCMPKFCLPMSRNGNDPGVPEWHTFEVAVDLLGTIQIVGAAGDSWCLLDNHKHNSWLWSRGVRWCPLLQMCVQLAQDWCKVSLQYALAALKARDPARTS